MSVGHFLPLSAAPLGWGASNLGNDELWGKKALVVPSCQSDCQPGGLTLRW